LIDGKLDEYRILRNSPANAIERYRSRSLADLGGTPAHGLFELGLTAFGSLETLAILCGCVGLWLAEAQVR
jgi:hypothetical protein